MFEVFEAYITTKESFTREELTYMRSLAVEKKLRRRQLLLREGEICQHKMFVTKGLLRNYRIGEDGAEYIMRFAPEHTWTIDHESYTNETPSKSNIEAIEDSEVIMWSREHVNELFTAVPSFRRYSERLMSNSMNASQDRILMNISSTSEEKYEQFITLYPDVFNRVPLHMVASYLGVSRETLSRIRHAQLKQAKAD